LIRRGWYWWQKIRTGSYHLFLRGIRFRTAVK